ncbi:MAG: ferredoxin--NADP reductase [Gammaproteobacteria bacterium]|nr:ferredoxin--NADP reductase [Gammaproteobacteria bacterium]NNL99116.1 ferredoxin--NADP reductase [Gammaproteobacteria bacterium]
MASLNTERVTDVKHWSDRLFSFTTTRSESFRFKNGHFTMIGLEVEGRPLMRAYSMASANYEEELEFLSIKVPDGALTSRLKDIRPGDEVLVSTKPTGTLIQEQLLPGKHLYLLSTGTGLAPFLSIIKDPEIYENFEKVILVHGVRFKKELAYADFITSELPQNEYFGELVQDKLLYYPTVTREPFIHEGRITRHLEEGSLYRDLGLPAFNIDDDRFMICGSMAMLDDTTAWLDANGYTETRKDTIGQYVIERAFVEK